MRFLRSNTAVIVTVGPFYDKTDGVTIETALTITNERITLTADTDAGSAPTNILDNITGATSATANDLNYITGNDAGLMQLELAAADVNRVGRMFLSITDAANHVPVFHEFMVLPQAIYDWLIAGTIVPLPANVTQILGTAVSTPATAGILDVNVKNIDNDAASAAGTVTFPNATLASTTNITAGTVSTATNVTTVNGLAANVVTAASIAAAALNGKGDWNIGKTGYALSTAAVQAIWDAATSALTTVGSIGKLLVDNINATVSSRMATFTLPTNFSALSITAGGLVDLTQAAADKVWSTTARTLSAAGVQAIWDALTSALTTASSIGKLLVDNINATISSRLATSGYTAPPTVGAIADQVWDEVLSGHLTATTTGAALNGATAPTAAAVADAVWDEVLADHLTAGTTGAGLNAAGGAGDPWATAIPGIYGAGTAGKILGDNVNATISSRASQATLDVVDDLLDTEVAAIKTVVDAVKAKTDNLPTDPADQSLVIAATDAVMTRLGAPAGVSLSADIAAIEAQTNDIGVAGAGLTALGDARLANLDATVNSRATAAALTVVDDFLDTEIAAVLAAVDTEVAAIKAKTDQFTFTTANQVDAQTLSVAAGAVTAIQAGVATEISDALRVDTVAAPTGVPGDTVTLSEQLGRLYQVLVNSIVVDATTGKMKFHNAAGAVIWEKDLTDAASVYTETKGNAP